MLDSGMLVEVLDDGRSPMLKATRLGRIAVRQMLSPFTVVSVTRALQAEDAEALTFLDLLLLCAQTNDCEPRIAADFEELEQLNGWLAGECSTLLSGSLAQVQERVGLTGRRLLAAIKTAIVIRTWTRVGCADSVAQTFGCYPFEISRLTESMGRILTAAIAVLNPPNRLSSEAQESPCVVRFDDKPPLAERTRALAAMVEQGIDEQGVTLTFLDGIGGKLARRLRDAGFADIEELALADTEKLTAIGGISPTRAARWIDQATQKLRTHSALSFREIGPAPQTTSESWSATVDPYRLRRALELKVQRGGDQFIVDGGLEPHCITRAGAGYACDCADFARGRECKHILAVRLSCNDAELLGLVAQLSSQRDLDHLDLFGLWFDNSK
jgi:helicase